MQHALPREGALIAQLTARMMELNGCNLPSKDLLEMMTGMLTHMCADMDCRQEDTESVLRRPERLKNRHPW